MLIIALLVLVGFTWWILRPEERNRVRLLARTAVVRIEAAAGRRRRPDWSPFRDALRARTRLTIVTPALLALNAGIFLCLLLDGGAMSDPVTALRWGASFGPLTTHGEWWRLLTMMFVHTGILSLAVILIGTAQAGALLERLIGPAAFMTVYLASGFAASLMSLAGQPIAVLHGASGAVLGVYGLLGAAIVHGVLRRSPFTIPLGALRDLAPSLALFAVYTAAAGSIEREAAIAALATGFVFGLVLARGVSEHPTPVRRTAIATAATAVIGLVVAISLRGVADVRPEIQRIVAFEAQTSGDYDHAVGLFTKGRISAAELAQLIDRTIVPELNAIRARLGALEGVPQEHRPLVATAEEYLRLRDESWRLRSEALHKSNMRRLRDADNVERASLDALNRIRMVGQS